MNIIETLAKDLDLQVEQTEKTVALIDEGNTIPFIARYRKEVTGSLDDTVLRKLEERLRYLRNIEARRQEVKNLIAEQYERAKHILQQHKEGHHQLAALLMEREVIFAEDAEKIFGKRPWASRSEEILEPMGKGQFTVTTKTETIIQAEKESSEKMPPTAPPSASEPQVTTSENTNPTSTVTETSEYGQPSKSKNSRKPKSESLFDGFDFGSNDQNEE